MLVYANHLSFQGADAENAIFKGVGGWLKEQLEYGLHPDQIRKEGEFNGTRNYVRPDGSRGSVKSWLRILATAEEDPELYAWVLKFPDDVVSGRQWIVEVGVKSFNGVFDVSCVVKTDEHSTLVKSPVTASQPRMIRYIVNNIKQAKNADFAATVPGTSLKTVGPDRDSYRALLAEIERPGRDFPIVLVSPTREGEYLLNALDLQEKLVGLAQVVQVARDFNSYEMSEVLGEARSAWGGSVNIQFMPSLTGQARGRYFLADAICGWGPTQHERIAQILAWVTNNTNIPRMRNHVRPEGVMQLEMRRRMQAARAGRAQMDAAQLRDVLDQAAQKAAEQAKYFDELVDENAQLESNLSELKDEIEDVRDDLAKRDYTIQTLKDQLDRAGSGQGPGISGEDLLKMACRTEPLLPIECLELIEKVYGDRCIILESAKDSAHEMTRFVNGDTLIDLLRLLVTEYRDRLMDGGDNEARKVFGKNDYAAKESETVMGNKAMRRQRTFIYRGEEIEMFRHLKIGVDDDVTRTIRVHFHWDSERQKMIVGYCGKHLSISSR